MVFENAIGIDVSRDSLDANDYQTGSTEKVENAQRGFKQLLKWSEKLNQVIYCFEHTGMYSMPLAIFLAEANQPFMIVSGLEIKRSLGLTRGKSDTIDARHLARYAYLRREEITPTTLPSEMIRKLKSLLNLRAKMVRQKAGYQATVREFKKFVGLPDKDILIESQKKLMEELNKQIKKIESEIERIIKADKELNRLFKLITSVKGVGLIIGASFLVYTNCFLAFDTWRKFASYSGIAPFEHQSGTSIKAPRRVHHFANKKLKTLLSNAATTSIQFNPEMKLYYQRRLKEGKSKMSTINIIRNKIVARVFASVKRGTPYVQTLAYA
jgi:transposase